MTTATNQRLVVLGRMTNACELTGLTMIGVDGEPPAAYVAGSVTAIQLIDRFNQHADLLAALKECSFRLAALATASGDFSEANAKALDLALSALEKSEGRD